MKTSTIRAALYMRYSSNAQNDGYSIEAQQKALKQFCAKSGIIIIKEYIDRARSGTNDNRPAFQQMIEESKYNIFDVVLVHKLDRFARNKYDAERYKRKLGKNHVKLESITEQFGEGIEADLMSGIQETLAEYYSNNLSREVKKGLDIVASRGLHTGGIPPLGYDVGEDRKLVINDCEAKIVRLIFDMYANNHTYNDIVHELNLRDYKTKIGKDFSASSLNSILNNRKYIGEYVYNKRASKDLDGKHNSHAQKPEEEIIRIPNCVPQIVDNSTFEKVAKRLEANKKRTANYQPNSSYLLTGLIYCGECGFKYQGNSRHAGRSKTSIYSSYRCGKKQNHKDGCNNGEIEKNKLETFVLEQMQKYLFSPKSIEVIKDLVNQHNKSIAKTQNTEVAQYEKQLKNVNSQIKNLTNAIAKGVNQEIFIDKINDLNITKKELENRIDKLVKKELPPVNELDVLRAMTKLKDYIKANNTFEIKAFMNQYIERITIYKERVEVTLKVASALFNSSSFDDKTGKVLIDIEISREKFKSLPKQRRKVPTNGLFGEDYLKGYRIVLN